MVVVVVGRAHFLFFMLLLGDNDGGGGGGGGVDAENGREEETVAGRLAAAVRGGCPPWQRYNDGERPGRPRRLILRFIVVRLSLFAGRPVADVARWTRGKRFPWYAVTGAKRSRGHVPLNGDGWMKMKSLYFFDDDPIE